MKKIAFGILLLGLAAGCGANQNNQQSQNQQSTTPNTQVYKNSQYNFEFTYPIEYTFTTPVYAKLENQIVQIQVNNSAYPNTNFEDADISISAQYAKNLSACLALVPPENSSGFSATKIINGATFYQGSGTGAGAGNLYESKELRTLHGTDCVDILETIHTGNIGNYQPGTVTQVNEDQIWKELDQIANTFQFTK